MPLPVPSGSYPIDMLHVACLRGLALGGGWVVWPARRRHSGFTHSPHRHACDCQGKGASWYMFKGGTTVVPVTGLSTVNKAKQISVHPPTPRQDRGSDAPPPQYQWASMDGNTARENVAVERKVFCIICCLRFEQNP